MTDRTRIEPTTIPEFFDSEDQLRTLKARDFPSSKEGKIAYCRFQIEKWTIKMATVEIRMDPLTKKRKKKQKLEDQLAMLTAELEEAEKESDEGEAEIDAITGDDEIDAEET